MRKMKMNWMQGRIVNHTLLSLLFALFTLNPAVSAPIYSITDLGDLSGGSNFSNASFLNENGQVVGRSESATGLRAFLWDQGIGMTNLGDLPGGADYSGANGINNNGQVAGYSAVNSTLLHGFFWENSSGMTDLGTLGGLTSTAKALNDNAQVVGLSSTGTRFEAFLWESTTGMKSLGALSGHQTSDAFDINNNGQIVGLSSPHANFTETSGTHAYLYESGSGMTDLGTLTGHDESRANGINESGQVVGDSRSATQTRAFLWESGQMFDLGDLAGGDDYSLAHDINDLGQVVGRSNTANGDHAFLWTDIDGMLDLNDLINPNDPLYNTITFTQGVAINNRGQIAINGISGTTEHAYLLTQINQVPEPSTLFLYLAALLGTIATRRKFI